MARLLPVPRDPAGRIACSECLKRNRRSLEMDYLLEFADHAAYDDEEFQLYGEVGNLRRKSLQGPAAIHMLGVPAEAVLMCVSCRYAAAAQRGPGEPVPDGEARIEPFRAYSASTGEEVEVPSATIRERR